MGAQKGRPVVSVHVPITDAMVYAAAAELQRRRVSLHAPAIADVRAALEVAFRAAEVRMDPPPPVNRVRVWLTGPDGPESVVCQIDGPIVPHGARVDRISVGHVDG